MAVTKHKKTQVPASQSAPKKPVAKKGAAVKETAPKKPVKKTGVSRKIADPLKGKTIEKKVIEKMAVEKKVIPLPLKPNAQTCPLVLDGLVAPADFSPRDCFSCDEFDCRFYTDEEHSGPLGSRLFASDEAGEDEEEEDDLLGSDRGEDDSDPWRDEDE